MTIHEKSNSPAGILAAALMAVALIAFPSDAAAQESLAERLSIHGHLSQAYGITDRFQYAGIPSGGTMDYRTAALQFRFDATDRDAMVIQLSHERLGRSPIMEHEPALDLDWAFYERRLGDQTRVRVGKIVLPVGIYNEVRDVGVILPLYRPPLLMYAERTYTVETMSGAAINREMDLGSRWRLSADAYVGEWDYLQFDLETVAQVDNALGVTVWLSTPLQGLRVGGSALGFTVSDQVGMPEDHEDRMHSFGAALDGSFERFFVRSEFRHGRFELGTAENYYGELGVHLGRGWTVVGQADFADIALDLSPFFPPDMPFPTWFDGNLNRNLAFGLRWAPAYNLVLKIEGHRFRGYGTEDPVRDMFTEGPARFHYALFSVSTSF